MGCLLERQATTAEAEAAIRAALAKLAAEMPFEPAAGLLRETTAAKVTGRKGRGPDGQAKTREPRLGCVFTQAGGGMHWGEKGVLDVPAIRCALLSGRMDAFWTDELARLRVA
ncbi:MAG: hypothetical protein WC789_02040 [Lentisphaeria bacterium]